MTCSELDHALIEFEASATAKLPPQLEEHLKGCKRCQEFVGVLAPSLGVDFPSQEKLHQIEGKILADLGPVRPVAPSRYFLAAFTGAFVLMVAIAIYRTGAFALAVMSPLQAAAILCALAVGVGLLAYSIALQMVPGSRHRIPPRLLPLFVMASLLLVMVVFFRFQHEPNFWANSWGCFRAGTLIGLLAAVPFWLLLRRGAILLPSLTGAATGMLAGLVGTTALEIHCPNLDVLHILTAHLGVAALGAAAGFVTGYAVEIFGRRSFVAR